MEIPCFFVKAPLAVVGTSRHKQCYTDALAICYVVLLYFTVIHLTNAEPFL